MKILSINNPYISHRNPTTAPEAIIGKGNIDASLFLIISFYNINDHIWYFVNYFFKYIRSNIMYLYVCYCYAVVKK